MRAAASSQVGGGGGEEEYEMVNLQPVEPEEMYEAPSSPNQPLPHPPPTHSPPPGLPLAVAGDEVVYDVIPGDQ